MTVETLLQHGFKAISLPEGDREIHGAYCGDLLSWVMGRARADQAWITIMSNINVVAVASLTDVACVILSEGVSLPEDVKETALQKQINVLSTDLTTYEAAAVLTGLI